MQHVKLGRTGLRVSRLCLGTMTFGLQCDAAQSNAILDAAAAGGVDFLDTADVYPLGGGHRHERPHRADRRRLADRASASSSFWPPSASARWVPCRGTSACRASISWTQSTPRCGGSAPTMSTSTSSTATIRTRRSTRRWRRSTRSCVPARRAMSASRTGRPTRWRARWGAARSRTSCASTRCNRATIFCFAASSATCWPCAPRRRSRSSPTIRWPADC